MSSDRRSFFATAFLTTTAYMLSLTQRAETSAAGGLVVSDVDDDDLFSFMRARSGGFDIELYRRLLGAANEFKEGDAALGLAAADAASRENARLLLGNTRIGDLDAHPVFEDDVFRYTRAAIDVTA